MGTLLCRRKTDGALFEPSHPDHWGDAAAITALLSNGPQFYFRRVELAPRRWWQRRARWQRTGEVWEPESGEFEVLTDAVARALAARAFPSDHLKAGLMWRRRP